MPSQFHTPLRILRTRLHADPSRVVLRPFHLGWQAAGTPPERATRLINDVMALDARAARQEYERLLHDFGDRHWQTEQMFEQRFSQLAGEIGINLPAMPAYRRRLLGAYFCHEYTYAAAALMNPSIVEHPDQSGLDENSTRFVMSVRAVGEGHISSIAFREGIARSDGSFELWPQASFAAALEVEDPCEDCGDGTVAVRRHPESSLSNSVIFPVTEPQRNGLEDLRLVRFTHDDGRQEWVGTYTAYSGTTIRSELLRTEDFRRFQLSPVRGVAGRNKGMALFPQQLDGQYVMVGRQDGKNLYLLRSGDLEEWNDDGVLFMEPRYPWEFIQIGNCGSPIRIDEGWLLFTHGVGAMRKYAIGCVLLDAEDPAKIIARSTEPVLTAEDADRSGYVPNVVYTCGALKIADQLLIPYGISDSAIGFGTIGIKQLLTYLA